mgnify:CR=1 FL=1
MIKLIAFDLDGTIGDTVPMCIRAFEKAVSPYAGHTLSEREITQTFGLNEVGMIKKVAGEKWREATRFMKKCINYARLRMKVYVN